MERNNYIIIWYVSNNCLNGSFNLGGEIFVIHLSIESRNLMKYQNAIVFY